MTVEELRTEMKAEFTAVRAEMQAEFTAVRAEMQAEFTAVRAEMQVEFTAVRAEIKAEGDKSRRHMEVLVEDIRDVVKIVAEATAQNTLHVNDHEKRLTKLEQQRT